MYKRQHRDHLGGSDQRGALMGVGVRVVVEAVVLVVAALVGASEVVPVSGGRLALGTWQQLVLIDFDDRPRERTVVIQVID